MHIRRKLLWVGLGSALALTVAIRTSAQLSDDERKCQDKINNDARKILDQEGKNNRKTCVKAGSGDVSACVTAESTNAGEKRTKLVADFGAKCGTLPTFGLRNDPQGIADAAEGVADTLVRDIFGTPPNGVVAGDKCHDKVTQRAEQQAVAAWKGYRGCLKGTSSVDSNATIRACTIAGIADGFDKKQLKLDADVAKNCSTIPPAGMEDGTCGGEMTAMGFSRCVGTRVDCAVCEALKTVSGATSMNCDSLDDGMVNSTCPLCQPTGTAHTCMFDGVSDTSNLTACNQGGCLAAVALAGSVDITCDTTADVNGRRPCSCALQSLAPVTVPGVGVLCFSTATAPSCACGEQDCDGGDSLGINLVADHEVGACTGHPDCQPQCTTYCAGLGKEVFSAACEGFCSGGTRDGLACECDKLGEASCAGPSTLECPSGSCEGEDNETDADCHCQCIDRADGAASAAGALQCNLGVAVRIETALPCDNTDILQTLPPLCTHLTSETHTGEILNADEMVATIGPFATAGTALTCTNLDADMTTGLVLQSNLPLFDSAIGDLIARVKIDCQ